MKHPLLYEINTRCWLRELSVAAQQTITLATVPESEFQSWRRLGFTHIWLMGVWSVGPLSQAHSLRQKNLRQELPDVREEDIGGSPYAIANYQVAETLGGEAGLKKFRERLSTFGLKLILDFIPNHVGLDHVWLTEKPELFVQSQAKAAGTFRQNTTTGQRWIAHGKDPYFEPWADTAQLDYRLPATRAAMIGELEKVAHLCDGVRCDMAMLLLNDVFAKTWQAFPCSARPATREFWPEAIETIKKFAPDFLFLAEVYWDLETRLQQLGFDCTYDKQVADCVVERAYAKLQLHLLKATPEFLDRSAHFLENHDEPRIATRLSLPEHRAAALLLLGLPGMRLLHEGQLTGAVQRVSVHLNRRPVEKTNNEVKAIYDKLLATLPATAAGQGQSQLLAPAEAWPGNPTAQNFIVVQWQSGAEQFALVVVNLAPHPGQCRVRLTASDLARSHWHMTDLIGTESYSRSGAELAQHGLYLDLPAHGAQLFEFQPVNSAP